MNNSDMIQLAGLALLLLAEQYMVAPWQFQPLARMWDIIARVCGEIANVLGFISLQARANYFSVVEYGS